MRTYVTNDFSIKAEVRRREGYRCQDCGMTNADSRAQHGRQLQVHRLVPGSAYGVGADVTACVCKVCHGKRHRAINLKKHNGRRFETMRVCRDVLEMARQYCTFTKDSDGRRLKLSDYFDSLIRATVSVEFARMVESLRAEPALPPPRPLDFCI